MVVVAGDIALFNPDLTGREQALDLKRQYNEFRSWLNALNMLRTIVVGVGGNHDFAFQEVHGFPNKFNWHYLLDSHTQIDDVIFFGSPWQPWMGGWAFNAPEDDAQENFLREKFSLALDDTDVFVTHTPPAGFHDTVKGAHKGSLALNETLERVQPQLAVYGHIHKPGVEVVDNTILCNASYVGFDRRPNGHPIQVFDIN